MITFFTPGLKSKAQTDLNIVYSNKKGTQDKLLITNLKLQYQGLENNFLSKNDNFSYTTETFQGSGQK